MCDFHGFRQITEDLDGREVIIVFPKEGTENGKWALKTEYFGAFPDVQIELLKLGYHLAHVVNKTRWHVEEDTDYRAKLVKFMSEKYNLSEKCAIIGMSCGGMQGIYFAAKYPQYVSCLYLDAPVVNLLSCPADLGVAKGGIFEEFYEHTGITLSKLIGYRNHPLDKIPELIKHNIPVILVCGDADDVVPYEENGKILNDMYVENNCIIQTIVKPGCNHHPHSLEDNTPIIDFILKYDK